MNLDKKIIIDELLERVNASPFVLVFDYTGMSVPQFSELRGTLTEGGSECHVAKNTYMRKALSEAGLPDIGDKLIGQTAFVTGDADVCQAAKAVKDFAKKAKVGNLVAGILDGVALDEEKLAVIANIPSRDALLGQLLSVINGPASALARVINAKYEGGTDAAAE